MRTKAEVVEHINDLMRKKRVTKSALGEALGASGGAQSKVQRANVFLSTKTQKLNMADLLITAQLLEVDAKDLILEPNQSSEIRQDLPEYNINPNHLVPLLLNNSAVKNSVQEWLTYPYDNAAHRKVVAVAMPSAAMQPDLSKGEVLFVDTRIYSFELTNRLILSSYKNEFIVGRFERLKNGQVKISFANDKFKPVIYSVDNENLEIIGVVIASYKTLK